MSKSLIVISSLGLALVISIAALTYTATHSKVEVTVPQSNSIVTDASSIDTSGFQAIFLQNDQVYFGHLSVKDNGDYKLSDIYYLQDSGLVKLGSESHQPKDEMFIPKDSVSFWENLQNANQFNGQLR